jgi:CRP/FNR family transcriptional regulator
MSLLADLHNCPLFAGITDDDLALLSDIVRQRNTERGELLFSEGERAIGFFIVASGRVKVYKLSADGKERILHIVQPGGTFAEAAIFGDGNYPAYAEPLMPTRLLFFPKTEFLSLLREHGQVAINMIAGLSRYLRQFASQVEQLTFQDVPARLSGYLLTLAAKNQRSVVLPTTKSALASQLGTVSETLSRTLRKLCDEEVIAVDGRTITLLDRERLQELAESTRER